METNNTPATIGRTELSLSTTWKTSPVKCLEAINPGTVLEAIKSPSPSLAFFHQDSPIKAAAILTLLISDLVKFYNVGKTMNDAQVAQTIKLIFDDENFRSFKPDDFKLCFKRMKTGFYGKAYDRIDGQVIFEALSQYSHERALECEQINIKQHAEYANDNQPVNPDGVKKVLAILKEAMKEVPVKEVRRTIAKSDRDKFIQQCFNEFYAAWLKRPFKPKQPEQLPGTTVNSDAAGKFIMFEWTEIAEGKEVHFKQPVDEIKYTEIKLTAYDKQTSLNGDKK